MLLFLSYAIHKVDSPRSDTTETLREEFSKLNRQIDELSNEKFSIIQVNQQKISDLQLTIEDYQRKFARTNDQLQQAEQKINVGLVEVS